MIPGLKVLTLGIKISPIIVDTNMIKHGTLLPIISYKGPIIRLSPIPSPECIELRMPIFVANSDLSMPRYGSFNKKGKIKKKMSWLNLSYKPDVNDTRSITIMLMFETVLSLTLKQKHFFTFDDFLDCSNFKSAVLDRFYSIDWVTMDDFC